MFDGRQWHCVMSRAREMMWTRALVLVTRLPVTRVSLVAWNIGHVMPDQAWH